MIYNFNLGIGWASSGVEYAQAYRAKIFRNIGADARFVFTDMFPRDNLADMTRNIGFLDHEILWLYTFFTDFSVGPVTYTTDQLEKTFGNRPFTMKRDGRTVRYMFEGKNNFYMAYLTDEKSNLVHRVELVSKGFLIRKDYYMDRRVFSEYYAPLDHKAHLYMRRFFNRDGSLAYEEMVSGKRSVYRFPEGMVFSKEELVGRMVASLGLTQDDVVIIDRTTGIGQAILEHSAPAKVGIVIHAEHYSENSSNQVNILWNNYYEYPFAQWSHVDFFVSATSAQNRILREQFLKYKGVEPNVVTIPVGSIFELKYPEKPRHPYSMITASRLAAEKHINWVISAVVKAKKMVPALTLDIYGKGVEEKALREQIESLECGEYIHLMGQQNLDHIYENYEAYIAGSTSEGFGLTLLEAVGAGLPIIGFDVHYGNQTFIEHQKNGYLISVNDSVDGKERINLLAESIVKLFLESNLEEFHQNSYKIAEKYLTKEVEKKWQALLQSLK